MESQPMSPEEIERTVQFLLHQQAQFAADFSKQSAKTDRMTEGILGLTSSVGRVSDDVSRLTERLAGVADGLIGLTGIVGRVTERLDRLAVAQQELTAAQQVTDRQLKEMNKFFERHLREDHGHRPS